MGRLAMESEDRCHHVKEGASPQGPSCPSPLLPIPMALGAWPCLMSSRLILTESLSISLLGPGQVGRTPILARFARCCLIWACSASLRSQVSSSFLQPGCFPGGRGTKALAV